MCTDAWHVNCWPLPSATAAQTADGEIRIPIALTQGDIADLVGASRKRVNQVMVAFKGQKLIGTDAEGHIITL